MKAIARPTFPVAVSNDGRYFVGRNGEPCFWLGDTQWELFRGFSTDEAREILEDRSSKGFSFIQVMLLGVGETGKCDGLSADVRGEKPWVDDDPLKPNEAYFANVDEVIQLGRDRGLVFVLGVYHGRAEEKNPIQAGNARAWAKWVAQRYREVPNIVWSMYPPARPSSMTVCRELVAGLQEGDGGSHLITAHPDPAPATSSGLLHQEPWLAFNTIQTYKEVSRIHPMVDADYRLEPVKPVVMAEGAYEAGIEYGFTVSPLWVRRQAYYTYLAGGHHSYGHNDNWRLWRTWRESLKAPGAAQMRILREVLTGRTEWWKLVPDQSVFAEGGRTEKEVANVAARHQDGKWLLLYMGGPSVFSVDMDKLRAPGKVQAFWIDPRSGEESRLGAPSRGGARKFTTPDGWEDAVLVVEAPG
jgi:hypothetical protein